MSNGYHHKRTIHEHVPHRVAAKIAANEALAIERLTPREIDVLVLLADGLENDAIADALGMRYMTARRHVSNILGKLGAANRTQAITIAYRIGLLEISRDEQVMTASLALTVAQRYIDLAQKLMSKDLAKVEVRR